MSRNPRTVRALVDLGLMRDQGEGIPRMFAEMEALFLPAPALDASPRAFCLTLRNTPTLTAEDNAFVAAFGDEALSDVELRAMLEVHRQGRVDNARMRQISGMDTLGASQALRRLRDRELLSLYAAGAASYYVLGARARLPASIAAAAKASDRGGLASDRGGFPAELQLEIDALGPMPRKEKIRPIILRLCKLRPWKPIELAGVLGLADIGKLVERHLGPMVDDGALEREYPGTPAHPQQAYRAKR